MQWRENVAHKKDTCSCLGLYNLELHSYQQNQYKAKNTLRSLQSVQRSSLPPHTAVTLCSSPTATEFGGQINRNCLFWAVIHVLDSHQHLVCALCVALLQITSWQMNATSRTSTVNSSAFILSENQTQKTNDKQTATGCAAFVPFSLVLVGDTM